MTSFTDDFTRADSTSLGANWVEVSGDWSIITNQLSSGSAGGTIILRAAGVMATSDNSAQVTIAATAAVSHGVWCRGNSNISQGYLWRNDGISWTLFSVVGGSFVSIGSYAAAAVAGDVAKVQAVGSTIQAYINGIQRVSVTNTAVTTGTSVGLRAESTSSLRFDDFAAADVVSGATGDAAFSGAATLSASGLRATAGAASLNLTASLTADGTVARSGDAVLATTAGLAASGQRATPGDAALTIAATLSADGQYGSNAGAGLGTSAALAAAGLVDHPGAAALAVTADLATQGQVAHRGDAALTALAALAADGTMGVPPVIGAAALAAIGTLTAAGDRTAVATASLTAMAALAAAGVIGTAGVAGLAATATLTAAGTTVSSRDDVDVTVGSPYSPWTAGQPYVPAWTVQTPQAFDWEVATPC